MEPSAQLAPWELMLSQPQTHVLDHITSFFENHEVTTSRWPFGPMDSRSPGFAVAKIEPGPKIQAWTYISLGCWETTQEQGHGLEFVLTSRTDNHRLTELITISSYYHCGPQDQRLDIGHTVPIGEPWLPGSACDHFLVSLPYPYGPELEICEWGAGHARLLWLLPITETEKAYRSTNGLESLEATFDGAGIDFTDPHRPSVA